MTSVLHKNNTRLELSWNESNLTILSWIVVFATFAIISSTLLLLYYLYVVSGHHTCVWNSRPQSLQWQLVSMKSPGSSLKSSLGLTPWGWLLGTVDVAVVVVAGSLLTFVDGLLVEVSASAAIDLLHGSEAFLQGSMTWKNHNYWNFCVLVVIVFINTISIV